MAVSIRCNCSFLQDRLWHCQWAKLDARRQVDRQIDFTLNPPQFVQVVQYLERILADSTESVPRPELDSIALRLRYRRNVHRFELRLSTATETLNEMLDQPLLKNIRDYHQSCLQSYAIAVYEGRTPIPEGYPEGYPEPHWRV